VLYESTPIHSWGGCIGGGGVDIGLWSKMKELAHRTLPRIMT
jgi:hypothetical protein